jgi:hypothetical protein
MNNKHSNRQSIVLLGISLFLLSGCLKDPNYTIVLPTEGDITTDIIPAEISEEFRSVMPIWQGKTPPNIAGQYLCSRMELSGSSLSGDNIGAYYADQYIAFIPQGNTLTWYEEQASSTSESNAVTVTGKDNNFTAYFVSEGTSSGIYTKESVFISGTITALGITNYHYAFIMLAKGSDPNGSLVAVNTYRIFKDSDGLAERYSWKKNKKQAPSSLLPDKLSSIDNQ